MAHITFSIGVIFGVLVLFVPRPAALAAYLAVVLCYPSYLVVEIAGLDISAGRIVLGALLLRYLATGEFSRLWAGRLSPAVALLGITSVVVPLFAFRAPINAVLVNRAGMLLDTYLSFAVTVLSVRRLSDFFLLAQAMVFVIMYLGIIGIWETFTGQLIFQSLKAYCPWASPSEVGNVVARHGFYRAEGPLSHPILFGMSFTILLPLTFWLRRISSPIWRKTSWIATVIAIAGALSSMSSGPWMILFLVLAGLALERKKTLVPALGVLAVLTCIGIAVVSNRPFYHVVASYADPLGGSGWHRAKLIDNAVEHFSEWWLCGYRGLDPGWGESVGMTWTDITNHYIVYAVQYGLVGLVLLVASLSIGITLLHRAGVQSKDLVSRSLFWSLSTIMVALAIAFNSCTLFAQTHTLFFVLLGLVSASETFRSPHLSTLRNGVSIHPPRPLTVADVRSSYV